MKKTILTVLVLSFFFIGCPNASEHNDREDINMSNQNEKVEKTTFA